MIDIHFHCLPALDDGPADWTAAVALCRAAYAAGTTTIVATPHVLRGSWVNDDPAARDALIVRLNAALGGQPRVVAGCEYWLSASAPQLLDLGAKSPLTPLNRSRYLLVEMPPNAVPPCTEAVFHEFAIAGVVPVIAHPERNIALAQDPERLEALVDRGARTQITASSLTGLFGKSAQAAAKEFLKRGLVHAVASDAHSVDVRPPDLGPARERVRKEWGADVEVGLFESNPSAILNSEELTWWPA